VDTATLVLLVIGLVLLAIGAEVLVRGATALAALAGISPLVVGLTVVAYGTSSPELAVSVQSALDGNPDIAVGNVVGSNIFNILFILGVCALVLPLTVQAQLIRREVPVMIAVSILLLGLALDGRLGIVDGAVLAGGALLYTVLTIRAGRAATAAERAASASDVEPETLARRRAERRPSRVLLHVAFVVGGLAMLVLGARWLVDGAVEMARAIGVDDVVIGLTVVAAGTSMPEVATSLVAALRGQRDIAVGNAVGSSIFNVLLILGVSALVAGGDMTVADSLVRFDIPVMIAVAFACLPLFFTGRVIARWEGAVFLGYYAAFTLYLLLDATGHAALEPYSVLMLLFVLPLTVVTIAVLAVRELGGRDDDGRAGESLRH
jgi:cation:H+ antiporter